jgi:hypothetical protein
MTPQDAPASELDLDDAPPASGVLLPAEFGALLAELNAEELPYVVVGGVAVNLLGAERATGDIDVLVPATAEQGAAMRRMLERLGGTGRTGVHSPTPSSMAHTTSAPLPATG